MEDKDKDKLPDPTLGQNPNFLPPNLILSNLLVIKASISGNAAVGLSAGSAMPMPDCSLNSYYLSSVYLRLASSTSIFSSTTPDRNVRNPQNVIDTLHQIPMCFNPLLAAYMHTGPRLPSCEDRFKSSSLVSQSRSTNCKAPGKFYYLQYDATRPLMDRVPTTLSAGESSDYATFSVQMVLLATTILIDIPPIVTAGGLRSAFGRYSLVHNNHPGTMSLISPKFVGPGALRLHVCPLHLPQSLSSPVHAQTPSRFRSPPIEFPAQIAYLNPSERPSRRASESSVIGSGPPCLPGTPENVHLMLPRSCSAAIRQPGAVNGRLIG